VIYVYAIGTAVFLVLGIPLAMWLTKRSINNERAGVQRDDPPKQLR
jgi:hypothetical protein